MFVKRLDSVVTSLCCPPKNTAYHVVSGSVDKSVRLWNVTTGKCVGKLKGHQKGVTSVSVSPINPRKGLNFVYSRRLDNVSITPITSLIVATSRPTHNGNTLSLNFSCQYASKNVQTGRARAKSFKPFFWLSMELWYVSKLLLRYRAEE